jgi:hypothetical protein
VIRALVFAIVAAVASQQPPSRDAAAQVGTASIAGVVIAAADKHPIGYARVTLNNSARITYTNAKGEFLFPKLPAGPYSISVQANGYLGMYFGQTRSGRPGVKQILAADEERKGIVLAMHKGGVVSGHVVGPDGRPLAGVNVGTLRKSWAQDGSTVFDWSGQGKTDDRGDYRITDLIAGSYLVYVFPPTIIGREDRTGVGEPQRLATEGMIQTFYPGTTEPASAMPLTVEVDGERPGIDFSIQPTAMWTVSGRVDGVVARAMLTGPRIGTERQLSGGSVRLAPSVQAAGGKLASNSGRGPFARVGPDGRFRFEAVPPGQYELLYQVGSDPTTTRLAFGVSTVAVVDRDIENATVDALPAAGIAGEVLTVNASATLAGGPLFGLIPLSGSWTENNNFLAARVDAPVAFTISNVPPGRYAFRPSSSVAGMYLSKIEIDGVPAIGTLIDVGTSDLKNVRVTYRTDLAEVSGSVRREDLTPVTEYALVVFPSDKREWPVWMTGAGVSRADSSGRYTYSTRPGSYLIAAVEDVDQFQWLDPAFLESLIPTATKITLGPGQKLTQDFVIK